MQRHFYATTDDLLPVFELVEKKYLLAYARTGLFHEELQASFPKGSTLPTLAKPGTAENAVTGPAYLVTEREIAVRSRVVQQLDGSRNYAVDQLLNPDSIVIQHGGLCASNVLISGRISTVSNTPSALRMQRAFTAAMSKSFTRVKAYWVGPQAMILMQDGARLTSDVRSPKEYDLTPD